jgi:hypothetical protein
MAGAFPAKPGGGVMPDQFQVQRQRDETAQEVVDEAMQKVEESRDKFDEREGRLVHLDETHYFDPQNKQVLLKDGGTYKNLGHELSYSLQAAAKIEELALSQGYKPVAGGFFWNPGLKHLYVKNGGHYVLYSPDRRGPDRHPE